MKEVNRRSTRLVGKDRDIVAARVGRTRLLDNAILGAESARA